MVQIYSSAAHTYGLRKMEKRCAIGLKYPLLIARKFSSCAESVGAYHKLSRFMEINEDFLLHYVGPVLWSQSTKAMQSYYFYLRHFDLMLKWFCAEVAISISQSNVAIKLIVD